MLTISSTAAKKIRSDASRRAPEEACGLLFGRDGLVVRAEPARNVAADPIRRFEIDPAALLTAHRRAREENDPLLGCYHSHPGGRAEPSHEDAAGAHQDDWLWLIATDAELRAYRTVERGILHGRFDPVKLRVAEED
jgi:proteasome lid subunit RPN8/RPN11